MDAELLFTLLVLWTATTMLLIIFLTMWFKNAGEAFHPHSVDVEDRHPFFLVVNSKTICKNEFAVKSISAFVAPRGASSSKYFTFLTGVVAITGILGSSRWYFVGDASFHQALISILGFSSLIFVACFELDVEPARFLEDKMIVTGWLITRLGLHKQLKFSLHSPSNEYRDFLRKSPEIYHLYEEDRYLHARDELKAVKIFTYNNAWLSLHVVGAMIYVALVPLAICLNDKHEQNAVGVVAASFTFFSLMGYLTGNYMPVLKIFQCWLLTWNPFMREPHFMLKLKRSVNAYVERQSHQASLKSESHAAVKHSGSDHAVVDLHQPTTTTSLRSSQKRSSSSGNLQALSTKTSMSRHNSIAVTALTQDDDDNNKDDNFDPLASLLSLKNDTSGGVGDNTIDLEESKEADKALDTMILRFAHDRPQAYLHIASYIVVLSELVALLTPSVLLGIQWITAFCTGPTVYALLDLIYLYTTCFFSADGTCNLDDLHNSHCILRKM